MVTQPIFCSFGPSSPGGGNGDILGIDFTTTFSCSMVFQRLNDVGLVPPPQGCHSTPPQTGRPEVVSFSHSSGDHASKVKASAGLRFLRRLWENQRRLLSNLPVVVTVLRVPWLIDTSFHSLPPSPHNPVPLLQGAYSCVESHLNDLA